LFWVEIPKKWLDSRKKDYDNGVVEGGFILT
jgi:hypothetical protein